ncbi:hypothetical protein ACFVU3_14330 [Streptomyces sp. NPDC058052]|uniref:hypothetical protein n=1 Tax=Streptomyces sp. NPDC058052 TaxID=3346316 RepID=UPI0036EAE429
MRTPVFELHIQPMFRAIDRDHMSFTMDLWDYDDVVTHADDIMERLEQDMPPLVSGGLWPEEWIALFKRWKEGARKRLELGTATYELTRTATRVEVSATGTFPAAGYKGWLQLENSTDTSKTYVLFFEAPDTPGAGTPTTFAVEERYRATDTRTVFVRDATGVHEVV